MHKTTKTTQGHFDQRKTGQFDNCIFTTPVVKDSGLAGHHPLLGIIVGNLGANADIQEKRGVQCSIISMKATRSPFFHSSPPL